MPSLLYRPHFFFSRRIYQLSPFFFKQTEGKKEKEESTSINHPRPRVIFLLLRFPFDRLVLQKRIGRETFTTCDSNAIANFPTSLTHVDLSISISKIFRIRLMKFLAEFSDRALVSEPENSSGRTITKSTSTPASLQAIVRVHGGNNSSLHHKVSIPSEGEYIREPSFFNRADTDVA